MIRIFIFAGTTEGRELAQWLSAHQIICTVSVATEYGALVMEPNDNIRVLQGRMNCEQMQSAISAQDYACIIDATHPFAVAVSAEIREACARTGRSCLRLSRQTEGTDQEDILYVNSIEEAVVCLNETTGRILLTTGSKELPVFLKAITNPERVYARVLPGIESLEICRDNGLSDRHVIAMQGPFGTDMNCAVLRHAGASFLVTKETGSAGGYQEKLEAARQCGVKVLVIRNPEKNSVKEQEQYHSAADIIKKIAEMTGRDLLPERRRKIILAGIGCGDAGYQTQAVHEALKEADVLFGAERVLQCLGQNEIPSQPYYQYSRIREYLEEHPEVEHPVVVFSGDTGFYSGASSMLKEIGSDWEVQVLCGISSVVYFASRIGTSWQDMTLLSEHGRYCNVSGKLRLHKRCFLLVSGVKEVNSLGKELKQAMEQGIFSEMKVTYGYQLSYPEEEIREIRAEELCGLSGEGLYVLLLENESAENAQIVPGIPDELFLRDQVPMTKEEIRSVSLCKLRLTRSAVVYDIGAGSGSVSVEAAMLCEDGMVFAVEQNTVAAELLEKNRRKFCLDNMQIVQAKAPDGLSDLPAPTHAFIGGSSGNLEEILKTLLERNPSVRIVINAVTLETIGESLSVLTRLPVSEPEYVQISVSRDKKMGRYHLMQANNPVYIISCEGKPEKNRNRLEQDEI